MKMTSNSAQCAVKQASVTAIRAHFCGEGAKARILRFVRDVAIASGGWTAMLLFVGSWAVIGGLLVGPEHDFFLTQVHSWMVATPVDQVLVQSHTLFVSGAWVCVKFGLLLGLGQKLLTVVTPAVNDAKQRFNSTLA